MRVSTKESSIAEKILQSISIDAALLLLTLTVAHAQQIDIVREKVALLASNPKWAAKSLCSSGQTRWGRQCMVDSAGFISGVWCGVILGAAGMLLVISLVLDNANRKQERRLQRVREIWR